LAELVALTIDGRSMQVPKGTTILQAASRAGIFIPQLCYWEGLPPYVGCRTCVVEVEGERWLQLSCTTLVRDGMVGQTATRKVQDMRRQVLYTLLSEHAPVCLTCLCCDRRPHCAPGVPCLRHDVVADRCVTCIKDGRCELQTTCEYVDMRGVAPLPGTPAFEPVSSLTPFIEYDVNRCILCARCVQVCDETRVRGAIQLAWSGDKSRIISAFEGPVTIEESNCEFCGACVDVCPCAALTHKQAKSQGFPDGVVSTICPYCACGCGLDLQIKDGKIIEILPTMDSAASKGQVCVKGRFGYDFIDHPDRLHYPMIRRDGKLQRASWDEALDLVAEKLLEHKGVFAGLACARATTEDNYVFQKFMRVVMGTNNLDHCARI
jgi:predicted molibdopterin-dependent oxidoreductase YjgC